ncbi:MAG: ribonuclease H-like domain-containing protein [Deltaproteobacteria bacterium]|nr:ribonuclease H-like domain-containing protein [Deltaproteobacteria bacterium]
MLKHTFIHLPGVGLKTEAHFWRVGLATWEDFLAAGQIAGLGPGRLDLLKELLWESLDHQQEAGYFACRLPGSEHWRLFRHFRARAAYLDIETYGSAWPALQVTVAGLYDGFTFRQFVHGINLEDFPAALADLDLLITFNGTQFDLPVLRAYFPGLRLPPVHLDLRFILARLGFKGGLKRIELRFGIHRAPEVAGLDGYDAVLLWERHLRGDRTALPLLLQYNREDVLNLERLMEQAFIRCREVTLAALRDQSRVPMERNRRAYEGS